MQYTPTTPKVLGATAGLGAAAILPATGSSLVNAIALATACALAVWALVFFAMRKKINYRVK